MRSSIDAAELANAGVRPDDAERVAREANAILATHRAAGAGPAAADDAWRELRTSVLADPRLPFEVHLTLYRAVFADRDVRRDGPPPAWTPMQRELREANVARLMAERGLKDYHAFHGWCAENRDAFWQLVLDRTGIRFRRPPTRIRNSAGDEARPEWLPGAELNIAESCFGAKPDRTAIHYASEAGPGLQQLTYAQLEALTNRVANGIEQWGLAARARVALYLPMTPESVALYLGVVKSGRSVVGIADASAPPDLAKRIRISDARLVFTVDSYLRDGKTIPVYPKVGQAQGPPTVVLPSEHDASGARLRPGDRTWDEFLSPTTTFNAVARGPADETNILFSSGTTKDPKAIVWTHTTPIKCIADAWLHHDVHPDDVLAWPTSFGWMMGPWLTYASLALGASMAIYNGAPTSRAFGEFVARAGVTMLGVVPKLVHAWRTNRTMEGLDWSRVRRFSSTGETSNVEDMLWLMQRGGYKPIIEYCGGTEIGGGYLTGTLVQPASPATFTTPALGLDLFVLDEHGRPTDRGEVAIIPPSIGLSNDLLNYDHRREYYEGFFLGPGGRLLRRHGDQLERMGGGYFRHHGRMDDMINLNGVKTSVEELRAVVGAHPAVDDTKPIAVDLAGTGQHVLVVYAIPRDRTQLASAPLRRSLQADFQRLIKEGLNPLLAHVHDVVLVAELPQAGPGKTRTMKEFVRDYQSRLAAREDPRPPAAS